MFHKSGGEVVSIDAIAHETYKGVADWYFIGRVKWRDGSESAAARIEPWALCHDDTEESQSTVREWIARLNRYLQAKGVWHDMKHKRDGRAYSWTPTKPAGEERVQS
jgi:hypothetical protein